MASVINTNTLSMVTQQNLNQSQNALSTSMERLSSGMRINSAKDDAAGQAIANRMSSQITGLSQAQRNANDGISIAQTAEGGLNQVNDNLQRIRELTVQAQNGTNSASDIDSIQQEVNLRLEEINRIAQETDFNGSKVLSKEVTETFGIQVGAQDGQKIEIGISGNTSWNKLADSGEEGYVSATDMTSVNGVARTIDAKGFDVLSAAAGTVTKSIDTSENSISGGSTTSIVSDSDTNELYISNQTSGVTTIDASDVTGITTNGTAEADSQDDLTVTFRRGDDDKLYVSVEDSSSGADKAYEIDESMIDENGKVTLNLASATASTADQATYDTLATNSSQVSAATTTGLMNKTEYYKVDDSMINDVGGIEVDLSELEATEKPEKLSLPLTGALTDMEVQNTNTPLTALDNALMAVDVQRSELGAIQNRFESAITNLQTNETNLSSARSRIEDADYADEVSSMTTAQILQQAGTSMLTQANQVPQNVLSLLG